MARRGEAGSICPQHQWEGPCLDWSRAWMLQGRLLLTSEDPDHCTHILGPQKHPHPYRPAWQSHQYIQGENGSRSIWAIGCIIPILLVLCSKEKWFTSPGAWPIAPQHCDHLQCCCPSLCQPVCRRHGRPFLLLHAQPSCRLWSQNAWHCFPWPYELPIPPWRTPEHHPSPRIDQCHGHIPRWCYLYPWAWNPEHC